MQNSWLRIEAFQLEVDSEDFEGNCDRILAKFNNSSAHISVFPESCTAGFPYQRLADVAALNGRMLARACAAAKERGRGLILPLIRADGNRYYNRQFCIGPDGAVLNWYDKIHLIGVLHEDQYLTPGDSPVIVEYQPGARIGLATCYDLRFPELFRHLVLKGRADLIIVPAMWPRERQEHFRVLTRARAIENQTPLIACNAVNACGQMDLCGRSLALNAKGEVLYEASESSEDVIAFELNVGETNEWRGQFPALKDAKLLPHQQPAGP